MKPLLKIPLPMRRVRTLSAFNPALPVDDSLVVAGELRDQFNGLKALIDAVPTISSAVVDGVTTVEPWQPAAVTVEVSAGVLHLSFDIPRGNDGATGADGAPGPEGPAGAEGPQGPPFANAVVDAVNTLPPWESATVGVTFDGTDVRFTFGIPQGYEGAQGPSGSDGSEGPMGPEGPQGPQGLPGEVSYSQLDAAISGTSANSNGVDFLSLTPSEPPTQAELQAVIDKVNELIGALRRP